MTCRHAIVQSFMVSLEPPRGEFCRCVYCKEVVPWPEPANDTAEVELEILAAEVASLFEEKTGPVVALCRAPISERVDPYIGIFRMGWIGRDVAVRFEILSERELSSYAAGALARQIYDGEADAAVEVTTSRKINHG